MKKSLALILAIVFCFSTCVCTVVVSSMINKNDTIIIKRTEATTQTKIITVIPKNGDTITGYYYHYFGNLAKDNEANIYVQEVNDLNNGENPKCGVSYKIYVPIDYED